MRRTLTRSELVLAGGALLLGLVLRWLALPYVSRDAVQYGLPWYAFAREHGLASLGVAFTNYAPAYSYLLLGATPFDGAASPITLLKAISFLFELGSALVGACIAASVDPRPPRPALAFALLWLAPSVLYNGAFWAQADAIWTFFVLLAVLAILRGRPAAGAVAFGTACAVKAQAAFLAPLGLALVLNGTLKARWILAIPLVYAALAVPTLVFGRSAGDVFGIYLQQGGTFGRLSMYAANLYMLAPPEWYEVGLKLGLALAVACALAFAWRVGHARAVPPDVLLLAAAVSLLLMPSVLPKMHERYFYAYELAVIVLAVVRPAFGGVAALAQLTSVLSYLPFDGFSFAGLPIAIATNTAALAFLVWRLHLALGVRPGAFAGASRFHAVVAAIWAAYALVLPWTSFWPELAAPGLLRASDPRLVIAVMAIGATSLAMLAALWFRARTPASGRHAGQPLATFGFDRP